MAKRQKLTHPAAKDNEGAAIKAPAAEPTSLFSSRGSASPSTSSSTTGSSSSSECEEAHSELESEDDEAGDEPMGEPDSGEEEGEEDNATDSEDEVEEAVGRPPFDAVKARSKLHQSVKSIRAAAKIAKAFELQRLVKKVKQTRKPNAKGQSVEELQAEIDALKQTDPHDLAKRTLLAKMTKNKLLPRPSAQQAAEDAVDKDFPFAALVRTEPLLVDSKQSKAAKAGAADKVYEKVVAMLVSSKKLADEVAHRVMALKVLAGLQEEVTSKAKLAKDQPEVKATKGKEKEEVVAKGQDWSGSEDEADEDSDSAVDVEDDDEDDEEELERLGRERIAALGDLSQWDGMLGSDSEEDEDEEDEGKGGKGGKATSSKRKRQRSDSLSASESGSDEVPASEGEILTDDEDDSDSEEDSDADFADSDDEDDSDNDSDDSDAAPQKKKKSKTSKGKSSSSLTFLPSLSTGFIGGRSDDDWSDGDANIADCDIEEIKSGKKKREVKNRMGQRARKALYEKKYGRNANHIKIMQKEKRKTERRAPAAGTEGSTRPVYGEGSQGKGWSAQRRSALPSQEKSAPRLEGGIDNRRSRGGSKPYPSAAPSSRPPPSSSPRPPAAAWAPLPQQQTFQPTQAAAAAAAAKVKETKAGSHSKEELHPSWVAKQKQKELAASIKPAGKKITFD